MSFTKLIALAAKIEKKEQNETVLVNKFKGPDISLVKENFAMDLSEGLSRIISEMLGDLIVLKELKFDKMALDAYIKIIRNIQKIYLSIKDDNPILAANELIDFVYDKKTYQEIEQFNFIVPKFIKIKYKEMNFPSFKNDKIELRSPQSEGLKNLLNLVNKIQNDLKQNQMLMI